jgi:hypothetical protein
MSLFLETLDEAASTNRFLETGESRVASKNQFVEPARSKVVSKNRGNTVKFDFFQTALMRK